jgi:alpha-1,6-mannosyltransferase
MLKNQAVIALIGLAALELEFAAMARLGDLKLHVIETIILALAAGAIYCVALYALEHSREHRAAFWLILAGALLFRLTLAPLPPTLSTDMYRYRWDGRVQNAGWNPYSVNALDPRLKSLRDSTWAGMPGPEVPAIYPPLAELIFRGTARITQSPLGFKTPFVLADLLVVAMLAGWLRSSGGRNYQLAVYAWSPLIIVEFAASGHSDALAIAFFVAALVIIRRRPGVSSTVAMMAGALCKLFPITLLPLAVRLAGWPRRLRGWVAAAAAGALAAACAWPYRSAAGQLPETFAYYRRIWQNYNPSLYGVLLWLTGRPAVAAGIGEAAVLILALWVAARKIEPVRAAFLVVGAILMFAPNGYSWYFTWIVPLLCFFPSPAWILLTVLQFLSYNVLIAYQITGEFRFAPLFQWLTYAPFYALLIWELVGKRGAFGLEAATSGIDSVDLVDCKSPQNM